METFQRNILKKINARFYHERDEVPLNDESSFDIIPGRRQSPLESFEDPTMSSIATENIDSMRLVRTRSNNSSFSGTGYLFLAIMFCMMCCSSLMVYPGKVLSSLKGTVAVSKNMNMQSTFSSQPTGRSLLSTKKQPHDVLMEDEGQHTLLS